MWDFATGQEFVRIEKKFKDNSLIAEIPLSIPDAELIAETICNSHNAEISWFTNHGN